MTLPAWRDSPWQTAAQRQWLLALRGKRGTTPRQGNLELKVGLFALDPDWVSAPVLDAYVHSALDNSLNLNLDGVPLNPAVAPGVQVSWTPGGAGEWGTWQLGGFWLEPADELGGLFGVNPGLPASRGRPPAVAPPCCNWAACWCALAATAAAPGC